MPLFIELPLLQDGIDKPPTSAFVNLGVVHYIKAHSQHPHIAVLAMGQGEFLPVAHTVDELAEMIATAKKREAK